MTKPSLQSSVARALKYDFQNLHAIVLLCVGVDDAIISVEIDDDSDTSMGFSPSEELLGVVLTPFRSVRSLESR